MAAAAAYTGETTITMQQYPPALASILQMHMAAEEVHLATAEESNFERNDDNIYKMGGLLISSIYLSDIGAVGLNVKEKQQLAELEHQDDDDPAQAEQLMALGLPTAFGGTNSSSSSSSKQKKKKHPTRPARASTDNGGVDQTADLLPSTNGDASAAGAAEPAHAPAVAGGGRWMQAYDAASARYYYFNEALGITQWEPPQDGHVPLLHALLASAKQRTVEQPGNQTALGQQQVQQDPPSSSRQQGPPQAAAGGQRLMMLFASARAGSAPNQQQQAVEPTSSSMPNQLVCRAQPAAAAAAQQPGWQAHQQPLPHHAAPPQQLTRQAGHALQPPSGAGPLVHPSLAPSLAPAAAAATAPPLPLQHTPPPLPVHLLAVQSTSSTAIQQQQQQQQPVRPAVPPGFGAPAAAAPAPLIATAAAAAVLDGAAPAGPTQQQQPPLPAPGCGSALLLSLLSKAKKAAPQGAAGGNGMNGGEPHITHATPSAQPQQQQQQHQPAAGLAGSSGGMQEHQAELQELQQQWLWRLLEQKRQEAASNGAPGVGPAAVAAANNGHPSTAAGAAAKAGANGHGGAAAHERRDGTGVPSHQQPQPGAAAGPDLPGEEEGEEAAATAAALDTFVDPFGAAAAAAAAVAGVAAAGDNAGGGGNGKVVLDPAAAAHVRRLVNRKVARYWLLRYSLFSRFDEGCQLDTEGWYSVTPEIIAEKQARWMAGGITVDGFVGCGGNAVQMALHSNHVVVVDNNARRAAMAAHNASIYQVGHKIDVIVGDYFKVAPSLAADCVFLSPPWGGPMYKEVATFDVFDPIYGLGVSLAHVMEVAFNIVHRLHAAKAAGGWAKVCCFLPRNTDLRQLAALVPPEAVWHVERDIVNRRMKGITLYCWRWTPPGAGYMPLTCQ